MIINFPREAMGIEAKKQLQKELLAKQLKWVGAKSQYYKGFLAQQDSGFAWEKIPIMKALPKDVFSLLTGPLSSVMRFNRTMDNKYVALSQRDLGVNLDMATRALAAANVNNTSIIVICGDYSMGHILDLHYASEALGATVLPCGNKLALQQMMTTFSPDTIIGNAEVGDFVLTEGINVPKVLLIKDYFPEALPANFHPLYVNGVTDQVGLAFICEEGKIHLQDDYLKWDNTAEGLVFTPLTAEAMPLLKVATKLQAKSLNENLCSCGRTLKQLA